MKKKLFLLAVVSLFALSGCGNNPPSLEERAVEGQQSANQVYEYTGVIEPLELDIVKQGTHQIRTDDNELVVIQSKTVNLSDYLDKRVTVTGKMAPSITGNEQVLDVEEVKTENGETSDEIKTYENRSMGFKFEYPGAWSMDEKGKELVLSVDGAPWVKVEVSETDKDLDSFVAGSEAEDGTPVTVGAQRSLRYLDGDSIRVYIPNPSKNKVYKITFNEEKRDPEAMKQAFYDLLESFTSLYFSKAEGEKCGGKEKLKCAEGYRCELASGEAEAEGVCVSMDTTDAGLACPFVPVPENCDRYEVGQMSGAGCPVRYDCLDGKTADDSAVKTSGATDNGKLISSIEKNKSQLLHTADAKIIQYEISESTSIVAVIYETVEGKIKILFSYASSGSGYSFIEKARFEEGKNSDWDLTSGINVQKGLSKTVIKAEGGTTVPVVVDEGMEIYQNTRLDFSMQYPKSWYYRSFGALGDCLITVGFADKSVEVLSDASILLRVFSEKPKAAEGIYTVARESNNMVFTLEGGEGMKSTIDTMAATIR